MKILLIVLSQVIAAAPGIGLLFILGMPFGWWAIPACIGAGILSICYVFLPFLCLLIVSQIEKNERKG